MIARRATLKDIGKSEFKDIADNRQRFLSVLGSSQSGVGTLLELHCAEPGAVVRRIVTHRNEAFEGRSLLSLRPLTSIEKSVLQRDAAPGAPSEGG